MDVAVTLDRMTRSFTKSQIDRLGNRLRRSERPAVGDLDALERLRIDYDPMLVEIVQRLRSELELAPTSRLKTTGTILDKLKREQTRLSTMQDIAGARIVIPGDLTEQDRVVAAIGSLFPESDVIDRRTRPTHGYRAVHLIVVIDGSPAEIQVRTAWRDRWAQMVEKTADFVGRQIRYRGEPANPNQSIGPSTVAAFVDLLMRLSPAVQRMEEAAPRLNAVRRVDASSGTEAVERYLNELKEVTMAIQASVQDVARISEEIVEILKDAPK